MATPSTPPPVVTIGDLYVDAQTQALWLGVDVSVDPAGSIPVADYNYMLDLIAESIVAAGAYTDGQIATRAPLAHTHVSGDITDFTVAVNALITSGPSAAVPIGIIAMWGGSLADIGVGDLVNWRLCDGANGTPDLRDRFVMGAGNVIIGNTNPAGTAATSPNGAHTPVIQGVALTAAQLPAHVHAVNLTGNDSAVTSTAGQHTHGTAGATPYVSGAALLPTDGQQSITASNRVTTAAGDHNHTVSVSININGNTSSVGSDATHTHLANPVLDHSHTVTTAALRAAIPYYALAFIKKIA